MARAERSGRLDLNLTDLFRYRIALLSFTLFVLFFALYASMAAPGLDWGDAGEAQLAAWTAGLAHPTGYPLFLILGWVWTHALAFVGVAPTRAMTLFSVAAGAATASAIVPMMDALLRRSIPILARSWRATIACIAALAFGLSHTFWSQALLAEVYTLNALFLVLLLWLLWSDDLGAKRFPYVALLYGLSLTHHRLMVFWLPGLLAWLFLEPGALPKGQKISRLLWLALLVAVPQVLYLYVAWRGPLTPYLHQPLVNGEQLILYDGSARAFIEHITGTVFASNLGLQESFGERLRRFWSLAWMNGAVPLAFPALVGVAGLPGVHGWLRLRLSDRVLLLVGLAGTLLFGLFYAVGDVEVMFIPAWLVTVILAFVGFAFLLLRFLPAQRAPVSAAVVLAAAPALLLVILLGNAPETRADHTAPERLVREIWAAEPPPNSILVTNDRNEMVPLWYSQFAEGRNREMLVLSPLMTQEPHFRNVASVVEWALQWGRPLFLTKPMPGLALRYDLEPYAGPLVRVEGPIEMPSDPVLEANLAPELKVVGWQPSQRRVLVGAGETLTVAVALEPEAPLDRNLTFSLQLFGPEGPVTQEEVPPDAFFPSAEWPVDAPVRLQFPVYLPPETPVGLYEWRLSAYELEGAQAEPYGQQVVLGRFLIGAAPAPLSEEAIEEPVAQFGDDILLTDADLQPLLEQEDGERALHVTLRWTVLDAPLRPYTLFIHLVDEAGAIVAQADAPPTPPTDTWVRSDIWTDERVLPLPDDLPPGSYTLRVGLYDAAGRLPVAGGGDAVGLGTVQVP